METPRKKALTTMKSFKSFFDLEALDIAKKTVPFSTFRGKPVLVVNVASECGYTPQYKGLQSLFDKYQSKGLVVMGFPCNQFGQQEPGTNNEIKSFCESKYKVTFPLFDKISVNGNDTSPVYQFLKNAKPGNIKWNFEKFLVDKEGNVSERFSSSVEPESLAPKIEKLL